MEIKGKKLKTEEISKNENELSSVESVLDDDFLGEPSLVEVYIGTIQKPKLTRHIILELNRILPVPTLQHLKRIRKNKIIVCLKETKTENEVLIYLQGLGFDISLLSQTLEKCEVVREQPKTRQQFNFANNLWPTNFHENKYLESLLSRSVFSVEEIRQHEKWMRIALEAAQRSEVRSGTVIIDPINNKLLAVGLDRRKEHPIKHSVMVTVDLIASGQGGGAWECDPADFCLHLNAENEKCREDAPYLCTGYYLYTTREPCMMCAMALVHSRIRRVFYSVPSEKGALGTLCKVHTIINLNHHYEVFRGLLYHKVALL